MTRARLISVAAIGGVAAAVAVASGQGSPSGPGGTVRPADARSQVSLVPTGSPRRQDPTPEVGARSLLAGGRPIIAGTAQQLVTARDPAGGPDWAVRAWQRRDDAGKPIWCSQLGRRVDGRFVWVVPGKRFAGPMPARETAETTVCAVRAPISDGLGIGVASLPDRDGTDPAAHMATTVVWGILDGPVRSARIQRAGTQTPVDVDRRAFLQVLPGTAHATRARLVVRDRDGGRREAIPPGFFDLQNPGGMDRVAQPQEVQLLARVSTGTDGVATGVFLRPTSARRPFCVAGPVPVVAGRPVQLDRRSGLVREPQLDCSPLPPDALRSPTPLRSGWTSGDPTSAGTKRALDAERRRTERRLQYGSGGALIVSPEGTRLLEVRSPVGVKTVRVGAEGITWVGFDGQPEVGRAMFPPMSGTARWERELKTGHTAISLRALDARGRQVGTTGTIGEARRPSPGEIRRIRKQLAERFDPRRSVPVTPSELRDRVNPSRRRVHP